MGGGGSKVDTNAKRFSVPSTPITNVGKSGSERSVTAGGSKKLVLVTGYVKPLETQKITVFGRLEGAVVSMTVGKAGTDVHTKPIFKAFENCPFYVADNAGNFIKVNSSANSPMSRCFYINPTHKENHITYVSSSSTVYSAKEKGEKAKTRGDALDVFDKFLKGWNERSHNQREEMVNEDSPWAAAEGAITVGSAIAVIGQIKVDKEGELSIQPFYITDRADICKELDNDLLKGPELTEDDDIETESFSTEVLEGGR